MGWKFLIDLKSSEWKITCSEAGTPIELHPYHYSFSIRQSETEYSQDYDGGFLSFQFLNLLEEIEKNVADCSSNRRQWERLFSDLNLMRIGGPDRFVEIRMNSGRNPGAAEVNALTAFFKAVALFLDDEIRRERMNASLAHLYCTWQWYSLLKYLTGSIAVENISQALLMEFSRAYRQVNALLSDDRNSLAVCEMQKWVNSHLLSGPLLREFLKTRLLLCDDTRYLEFQSPYTLLEKHAVTNSLIDWSKTRLHPVFASHPSARKAVRAVISQYIFPRYDFDTSLHLVRLLKNNQPERRLLSVWHYFAVMTGWLLALLAIGSIGAYSLGGLESTPTEQLGIAAAEFVLGPLCMSIWFVRRFDVASLANLVAPRIFGGVMIGYLTILLQSDSVKLNNALWGRFHGLPAVIMLAGVLTIGALYLYFDILPQVRDQATARARTAAILFLALLLSFLSGTVILAIATAMYPPDCMGACMVYLFGPFGWLNLAFVITFVPLALMTGLVTQFIFEERTVTAPVWAPEEE